MNGNEHNGNALQEATDPLDGLIFLSVARTATVLDLSERQIYNLADADELEKIRQGARVSITVCSIRAYVARRRAEATERRKAAA